jgi:5-(carboxyamino)imidazole ribonucleotide synthase
MVNLIGSMPDPIKILSLPFVRLHDYAKEPRSGRKVGHLNILPPPGADPRACLAAVAPLVSEETRAAMLGPIPGEA